MKTRFKETALGFGVMLILLASIAVLIEAFASMPDKYKPACGVLLGATVFATYVYITTPNEN